MYWILYSWIKALVKQKVLLLQLAFFEKFLIERTIPWEKKGSNTKLCHEAHRKNSINIKSAFKNNHLPWASEQSKKVLPAAEFSTPLIGLSEGNVKFSLLLSNKEKWTSLPFSTMLTIKELKITRKVYSFLAFHTILSRADLRKGFLRENN